MPYSRSVTMVAALAVLPAALAGCVSRGQSDSQSTTAPAALATTAAQATTAAVPAAVTAAADATAQPQSAATVAAAAANAALAQSDGDKAGTRVALNSLVRGAGDTITLRFTVVNNSAAGIGMYQFLHGSGYQGAARDSSGVHLIDAVSKKKYFPLSDTDNICLCSQDVADLAPNTQTAFWVKFPAPPASVKKISVEVPHFVPLDDVPITQ
jgi:hypothetical protein